LVCVLGKDQPRAQKRVYISRPTNIADVASARRFRFFIFYFLGLALTAKPNAVPDTAGKKYEVVYLG
jgi:hypothetical protein